MEKEQVVLTGFLSYFLLYFKENPSVALSVNTEDEYDIDSFYFRAPSNDRLFFFGTNYLGTLNVPMFALLQQYVLECGELIEFNYKPKFRVFYDQYAVELSRKYIEHKKGRLSYFQIIPTESLEMK